MHAAHPPAPPASINAVSPPTPPKRKHLFISESAATGDVEDHHNIIHHPKQNKRRLSDDDHHHHDAVENDPNEDFMETMLREALDLPPVHDVSERCGGRRGGMKTHERSSVLRDHTTAAAAAAALQVMSPKRVRFSGMDTVHHPPTSTFTTRALSGKEEEHSRGGSNYKTPDVHWTTAELIDMKHRARLLAREIVAQHNIKVKHHSSKNKARAKNDSGRPTSSSLDPQDERRRRLMMMAASTSSSTGAQPPSYIKTIEKVYKTSIHRAQREREQQGSMTTTTTTTTSEESLDPEEDPEATRNLNLWISHGHSRRGLERWSVPHVGAHCSYRKQMLHDQVRRIQHQFREHQQQQQEPSPKQQRQQYEELERALAETSAFYTAPSQQFARVMGQADAVAARV